MITFLMATLFCQTLEWRQVEQDEMLRGGTVITDSGTTLWHFENTIDEQLTVPIVSWPQPEIKSARYMLKTRVRAQGQVEGYLEMWSHFEGGGQYFTRTLAQQGPMARIVAPTSWRDIHLPFDTGGAMRPTHLELNGIFTGKGTVELEPLTLVQYDTAPSAGSVWTMAPLGLILVMLSAVAGVLAYRGRCRRFGNVVVVLFVVTALAMVAIGAFVYHSMSVVGAGAMLLLFSGIFGLLLGRRYRQTELRRMHAMDDGTSF